MHISFSSFPGNEGRLASKLCTIQLVLFMITCLGVCLKLGYTFSFWRVHILWLMWTFYMWRYTFFVSWLTPFVKSFHPLHECMGYTFACCVYTFYTYIFGADIYGGDLVSKLSITCCICIDTLFGHTFFIWVHFLHEGTSISVLSGCLCIQFYFGYTFFIWV